MNKEREMRDKKTKNERLVVLRREEGDYLVKKIIFVTEEIYRLKPQS